MVEDELETKKFKVYVLKDYRRQYVQDVPAETLAERMQDSKLQIDPKSDRFYGFVKIKHFGETCIYGAFTQEYLVEGKEYDSVTKEEHHVEQLLCEDRWFLFKINIGLVLLESTSFPYNISELTFPKTRKRFFGLLKHATVKILSRGTKEMEYSRVITQTEMLNFFKRAYRVTEMDVDRLLNANLPRDIQLSNPDPKNEKILKTFLENQLKDIDRAKFHAGKDEGDLKNPKLPTAYGQAGRIKEFVDTKEDGQTKEYKRVYREEIEIRLRGDKLDDETVEDILQKLDHPIYSLEEIQKWLAKQTADETEPGENETEPGMFK